MFEKESAIAEKAAKTAGDILNRMLGNTHDIVKKGAIDLVTEADLAAEQAILGIIGEAFPKDSILSEEAGRREEPSQRIWIIDPLDGTTNYAHGFPFFAVSIALSIEEEVVMGVVYNPRMAELFRGEKGQGARLNNVPIAVTETPALHDALLATGFPYDVHENSQRVMTLFERFLVRAQGIRRLGTAALDMCYVAAGRLDGFWEQDLKPWDTAAGDIILREAGGRVTTFSGAAYTPYEKTVATSNGLIHDHMISVLGA